MPEYKNSILVTGGTVGLGFHAAMELARARPDHCVVVASRRDANNSAKTINEKLRQDNVQFLPLDLGSLRNVRDFVDTWTSQKFPPISIMLLNAGLQFPDEVNYTADGFEATFGINHVGHALLFHLLQPHLAFDARIVLTASGTHDPAQNSGMPDADFTTAEDLAHPKGEALTMDGRKRYSTSKLCNVLWTYALARRLEKVPGKKWTVAAFDPGLMPGTGLAREYGAAARFLWNHVLPRLIPLMRLLLFPNIHRPEESGRSLAWTALDSKEAHESGVYYEGRKQIKSSMVSYEEDKQEELWTWTVKNVAKDDQERKAFGLGA
jgi:NAD(P)-dependent dehydrogenase (short-subunit alcohol dehydrogenase family)